MRFSPIESEENIIDPQSLRQGEGSCFYCMLEAGGGGCVVVLGVGGVDGDLRTSVSTGFQRLVLSDVTPLP